ncbi:MAG: PHP domain-containing protein [Sulfobacillus sp.]
MLRGDLHTHTLASDGTLATPALCQLARQQGLAVLAITDHDTVAGWPAAGATWPQVVGGVQITTICEGQAIDLLGYYRQLPQITNLLLVDLQAARRKRVAQMVLQLQEAGADISHLVPSGDALAELGRPHLAQMLVRAGHAVSVLDAFDRFLDKGRPGFVPRAEIQTRDVIEAMHADHGLAVLAFTPGGVSEEVLTQLVEWGVDGIEAYHPKATPAESLVQLERADRLKLLITGGSDFHRPEAAQLGVPALPEQPLLVFLAALERRQMVANGETRRRRKRTQ